MQKFPLCSFIFSLLFGMAAAAAADCKGINGVSNLGDETSLSGKTEAAAWVGKRLLEVEAGFKVCGRRFFVGVRKALSVCEIKKR